MPLYNSIEYNYFFMVRLAKNVWKIKDVYSKIGWKQYFKSKSTDDNKMNGLR